MKRCFLISLIITLLLSFCSNKHKEYQPFQSESIVLESRCALYQRILEQRLERLEKEQEQPQTKVERIRPVNASYPIYD